MRSIRFGFIVSLWMCFSGGVDAGTRTYGIVIGNNHPPTGAALDALKYADDDAVRYFNFFVRFNVEARLMTVLDTQTQRRYPDAARASVVPSAQNLARIVEQLRRRIAAAQAAGDTAVVYFVFSGHGAHDEKGTPFLTLTEGRLSARRLYEILSTLNADYTHLFIDACYAESIVGMKGMFDDETNTESVTVTNRELDILVGDKTALSLPGLGVVMATSEYQKTHEWSRIESGIFTHEVLSALAGPADVNIDGKIEYSELMAFISSANRMVSDPRARIRIVAVPPKRYQNIPLVDLSESRRGTFLLGDVSRLGHFHIELENGERYLDANLGQSQKSYVIVPSNQRAYLVTRNEEAVIQASPDSVVTVASLRFKDQRSEERGSIDGAFQSGLFTTKYTTDYYLGFIDNHKLAGVRFGGRELELTAAYQHKKRTRRLKGAALASIGLAGAAAAGAAITGAMALKTQTELEYARVEKTAAEINARYHQYTALFWPAVSLVPVGLLAGFLLWPKRIEHEREQSSVTVAFDAHMLRINVDF